MKPKYKKALIVTASTIIAMVLLLGAATLLLNTSYVQQRLLQKAVSMLAEKLNTSVEVDSVSVNLFVPSMALYGLRIDDQQGDSLLRMEQLTAQVSVVNLWKRQFLIQQVNTEGLDAKLVQNATDSVPNYQFLIDAFKKKDTPEKSEGPKAKKKWDVTLHPQQLHMQRTHICSHKDGKKNEFTIQQLDIKRKNKEYRYSIEGLQLATDNGTPRKNMANPRKGKFDAGHLNLSATLKGTACLIGKDSISVILSQGTIQDPETGINISDLHLNAGIMPRQTITLTDIALKQGSTTLAIERVHITLPDTTAARSLAYEAENITGQVILHDIAQPFVPALKNFHLPLQLSTHISGTANEIRIPWVQVSTNDKRLNVTANGRISNLGKGLRPIVNFNVTQLRSKQGMAEKVINQFIVKKLMMNQLRQLGDISYKGHFNVAQRCETFTGQLGTKAGTLNFRFTIDGNNGRLLGSFNSPAIKVGQVMEMPNIGDVDCQAEFNIDISKMRTAKIRGNKDGKLPIGTVTALINDCSYKRTHVRNISINIQSDGTNATGDILQQGNRRQISCEFIYNENDPKHKLRIMNPGIHFGKPKNSEASQDSIKIKKKKERKEKKKKSTAEA